MTKRRALMTPEERDRADATRRAYTARRREELNAQMRRRRAANREQTNAAERELRRNETPEQRLKYTEENREHIAARNAAWSKANPERHRAHQQNRRARKMENGGRLSPDIVQRLFVLQRGRCACCGAPLGDAYDLDHIVPLALGGANSDDNVQLLTARCNRQKGASDPVAFMQQRRGRLL